MNASVEFPLGLRFDLENEEYHAGLGLSNSGLTDMARCPAFFYGMRLDPLRPPTPERAGQLEGTLTHCATFEPNAFLDRYVVLPSDAPNRPTSRQWTAKKPSSESLDAMQWWTEFEAENAGKRVITFEQKDSAFVQAAALRALPEIGNLLAAGRPEVSAYWIDEETGELCRCRPDWVHPVDERRVILLDVKTYSDASPQEFARQVARKGYHRQDAWYSDGYAKAAGVEVVAFVFAAVETKWPYGACACMLDDAGREKGHAMNRALLSQYAECKRTNTWPGYSAGIELISLPRWAA